MIDKADAVVVDGGVRRGSDVVAALSAGADVVAAGRPFAYGLSAGGRNGVARVFEILAEELETAMGFVGATSVAKLGGAGVFHSSGSRSSGSI